MIKSSIAITHTLYVNRECLETGDVKFDPHQSEGRGSLLLSNGTESLDLQLVELPSSDSRAETKGFLFSVVKHMTQMRAELASELS